MKRTGAWVEWCELQVNDFVREYCPVLDSGDVDGATLAVDAEDAPDDVQEQEDCERWSRAIGNRYAGRN